ncbi:MAG: flagellar biosynthetic protein FliR [Acidobacteria bacterium]|nr:flagellar biosynthetic protein FliR [Acidobacteriota bacterium]
MQPVLISQEEVLRFSVVLFRVAGIMAFAPFFSSRAIPYQVRVAVTLAAAVVLYPSMPAAQLPNDSCLGFLANVCLGEVMLGMVLGLAASFVFAGMQLAGQIIAFQLGFSIINLIDPQSDVETSVISFLQYYLGILFFLLINGHHWFFLAVSESFQYLPVQGLVLNPSLVREIIRLSAQILVAGVQIAAPVIAVTLISDVVLALLGRAAPQIHILIVGLPLKSLVGFAAMSISFYFLPRLLGKYYLRLHHELFAILHRMA